MSGSAQTAGHPPAAFDFLAPPQGPGEIGRLGGYRILKVLGQGGMGVVFQAQDVGLDRLCSPSGGSRLESIGDAGRLIGLRAVA